MKQLCQEIEKIIELKGLKKIDIAKQIGVTPTAITKVLKGKATFELILEFLKAVEPDHYLELLTKDDNLLKINTKNWRDTLEFASTNRLLDLQEKLVEKALNSNNKRDNEFGMVYGVLLTWQDDQRTFDNVLFEEVKKKVNCDYMRWLIQLIDVYLYHGEGNFTMVDYLIKELKEKINLLDDSYIKKSLYARMLELVCHVELRVHNNVENAINKANELINYNIGKTFSAYGFYIKGLCLAEKDIITSQQLFSKSIDLYMLANKKSAAEEVKEVSEFLSLYYDYEHNEENLLFNISKSLFAYKNGDYNKGLDLIEKVTTENPLRNNLRLFVEGLLKNDQNIVMNSLIKFVKSGDRYFANIPKKWLLKNNSCYLPILNEVLS
jgi:transcriptional regulator with XRE-family HTH domain